MTVSRKKSMIRNAILLASIFAAPFCALGIPQGTKVVPSLKGRVIEWVWRGEIVHQTEGSYTTEKKVEVAAHYLAVVELEGADPEVIKSIRFTTQLTEFRHPIIDYELKEDQVVVWLPSDRWKEMRKGAELEITDYRFFVDDWSAFGFCKAVKIDGKNPSAAGELFPEIDEEENLKKSSKGADEAGRKPAKREQGGAEQPATAPESKPEGNEKSNPESEGRPQ